jgi:hypothetical protein
MCEKDDSFFGFPLHEQREVMELLDMVDIEEDGENGGLINTMGIKV